MGTDCFMHRIAIILVFLAVASIATGNKTLAQSPSFDCSKVEAGSTEDLVCKDSGLSALDRKLSDVYAEALKKAANERSPLLKAEQRGWIKGRNDCWKTDDVKMCVKEEYLNRIAELRARYRLLPGTGPITFLCEGNPKNEIIVTFFKTDPPTLIAERGDSVSLMYLQPSGSGAKYQGQARQYLLGASWRSDGHLGLWRTCNAMH